MHAVGVGINSPEIEQFYDDTVSRLPALPQLCAILREVLSQ